jgi:hypothetical protein
MSGWVRSSNRVTSSSSDSAPCGDMLGVDPTQAMAALNNAFASFFGTVYAAWPSRPSSAQLTADKVKVASDPGDLVKWCADDNNTSTLVRVANNRGYAVEADYPST